MSSMAETAKSGYFGLLISLIMSVGRLCKVAVPSLPRELAWTETRGCL